MKIEIVQRAFKLLFPTGFLWDGKTDGDDLEQTINGFSHEFRRIFDGIEGMIKFFLPYSTGYLPELEKILGQPNESLTVTQRQGRCDGRMKLLFTEKGRLNVYEDILQTAAFDNAVVRTLATGESPFDYFSDVGLAFYGNENIHYGDNEAIFNNTGVSGDAYLLTNGGSVNFFEQPEDALVALEQNPLYWVSYLVVEGPSGAKLQVPRSRQETFFDLVYMWKPAGMHVILNIEFTE